MVLTKSIVVQRNKDRAARTGAMWTRIFATFVTDQISFLVHVYLLAGDVLATIVIGAGILWEHGPAQVRKVADKLVLWGVVAETLCSVTLFTFDEGISSAQKARIDTQQGTIIALEKRLAARTLTDSQVLGIAARLSQFKGQEFDIVTYWKNSESLAITNRIYGALASAGWKYDKPPSGEFIFGVQTGVTVWHDDRAPVGVIFAAKELIAALNANNIDTSADDTPQNHAQNEPITSKLLINVGIKP